MTEEQHDSYQWNNCKSTESIGPSEVIPVTVFLKQKWKTQYFGAAMMQGVWREREIERER